MRRASYVPIIVLGEGEEAAEILELGADAFMATPPDARELKARVGSILRRKRNSAPPGGDDGDNDDGIQSHNPEKPPKLTDTEIRLDSCLKLNQGRVMGYRDLIKPCGEDEK